MKSRRFIIGLVILVFGALALVEAMGFIDFDWSWLHNWNRYIVPVILLLIGAKLISSSRNLPHTQNLMERDFETGKDGHRLTAQLAFSGSQFQMNGKDFPGADINLFMAGATLDLRGANIEDGCTINVRTMIGGLELWVSPDIRLEVVSNCLAGGVGNHVKKQANADAKMVVLNANCFFGGVDIKD